MPDSVQLYYRSDKTESTARSLHLHTLDSLLADLVSGRAVVVGEETSFALADERTRSALQWYRARGAVNWIANVSAAHGQQLVDAILNEPPVLEPLTERPANANNRQLTLVKLEAHRFAGLHTFGTPTSPPKNYVHEVSAPLTLYEGLNGSGKTSLANAIIWALTGQILRPQREPEKANEEFECWVTSPDGSEELTTHRLTPVTPMPDVAQYRPEQSWVPADTWVELTFMDEDGTVLPPIRRSQRRTMQGRLDEMVPDLSALGLDPIAVRIGTVMPGLLPLIKIGHESELSRAVAELTGLSALTDLAGHAQRAKSKIQKEFIKVKIAECGQVDRAYETAEEDLESELERHPSLIPPRSVPAPSDDPSIEGALEEITQHFEFMKAAAYQSVRNILGEGFDPTDAKRCGDLEKSIRPALNDVSQPQRLSSIARLRGFRDLTDQQILAAEAKLADILREAKALEDLAKDPSSAARSRLYAQIAAWINDHPDRARSEDLCVVCGGSLIDAVDPISGKPVKAHIYDAKDNPTLLAQTLRRWSTASLGELTRCSPQPLQAELTLDLPAHPCDLIHEALINELFGLPSFSGELAELRHETAKALEDVAKEKPALAVAATISLPVGCEALADALRRLDLALRFARWRHSSDAFVRKIFESVLGRRAKEGAASEEVTLVGKLLSLEAMVARAEPITKAHVICDRLKGEIKRRREAQKRIREYETASLALTNLMELGRLADQQVEQLRSTLRTDAAKWRSRIYLSSFPSTAHVLVDTPHGEEGPVGSRRPRRWRVGACTTYYECFCSPCQLARFFLRLLGICDEGARRPEDPHPG
jgi:hypothetical protein